MNKPEETQFYFNLDRLFDATLVVGRINDDVNTESRIRMELTAKKRKIDGEILRLVKFGGAIIDNGGMDDVLDLISEMEISRQAI